MRNDLAIQKTEYQCDHDSLSIVDDPAHHLEELVAILVRCRLVNQEKLMEPKQRD